jgi:hypothetical protein
VTLMLSVKYEPFMLIVVMWSVIMLSVGAPKVEPFTGLNSKVFPEIPEPRNVP